MDEGKAYIDHHQLKHELELQEKIVKMLKKSEVILKAGKEKQNITDIYIRFLGGIANVK